MNGIKWEWLPTGQKSRQDASEHLSEMIGDHKFAIQYGGSRLYFDSHLPGLGSRIVGAFPATPSGIIRVRQRSKAIMFYFIDPFAGVEPPLKGKQRTAPPACARAWLAFPIDEDSQRALRSIANF
jgi:hypothetical protein